MPVRASEAATFLFSFEQERTRSHLPLFLFFFWLTAQTAAAWRAPCMFSNHLRCSYRMCTTGQHKGPEKHADLNVQYMQMPSVTPPPSPADLRRRGIYTVCVGAVRQMNALWWWGRSFRWEKRRCVEMPDTRYPDNTILAGLLRRKISRERERERERKKEPPLSGTCFEVGPDLNQPLKHRPILNACASPLHLRSDTMSEVRSCILFTIKLWSPSVSRSAEKNICSPPPQQPTQTTAFRREHGVVSVEWIKNSVF